MKSLELFDNRLLTVSPVTRLIWVSLVTISWIYVALPTIPHSPCINDKKKSLT